MHSGHHQNSERNRLYAYFGIMGEDEMAKKRKKSAKGGTSKKNTARKKTKTLKLGTAGTKKSFAVKAKVMKSSEELLALRSKFAASISVGVAGGACYFKDPSGGPDQCIPATEEDCKSEGGVWSPGNCRN
jgi:hypothetical protein